MGSFISYIMPLRERKGTLIHGKLTGWSVTRVGGGLKNGTFGGKLWVNGPY